MAEVDEVHWLGICRPELRDYGGCGEEHPQHNQGTTTETQSHGNPAGRGRELDAIRQAGLEFGVQLVVDGGPQRVDAIVDVDGRNVGLEIKYFKSGAAPTPLRAEQVNRLGGVGVPVVLVTNTEMPSGMKLPPSVLSATWATDQDTNELVRRLQEASTM